MAEPSREFLDASRAFLTQEYLPQIERSVERLTPEQVWSRSNEASNSIGNLLAHLAGSTRYWSEEVIGGEPIHRVRQQEFDQRAAISTELLLADLRAAVSAADARLKSLSGAQLLEYRTVRDERATVLWCVYHIVEHFAMHTGQIVLVSKALRGAEA